jgi:hypothetical protein
MRIYRPKCDRSHSIARQREELRLENSMVGFYQKQMMDQRQSHPSTPATREPEIELQCQPLSASSEPHKDFSFSGYSEGKEDPGMSCLGHRHVLAFLRSQFQLFLQPEATQLHTTIACLMEPVQRVTGSVQQVRVSGPEVTQTLPDEDESVPPILYDQQMAVGRARPLSTRLNKKPSTGGIHPLRSILALAAAIDLLMTTRIPTGSFSNGQPVANQRSRRSI